jgi:uncharacterized protein YfeS
MSTRSTVHFVNEKWYQNHIVYVHHDGYPSYRGRQVMEFLRDVKSEIMDTRFSESGVTAARFVGYMLKTYHDIALESVERNEDAKKWTDTHPLGAISVKLMNEDPGDIEYRYIVRCDQLDEEGIPKVMMQEVVHMALLDGPDNMYAEGEDLKGVLANLSE